MTINWPSIVFFGVMVGILIYAYCTGQKIVDQDNARARGEDPDDVTSWWEDV